MKLNLIAIVLFVIFSNGLFGQNNFSDNPLDATFETKDSKNFWEEFDKMSKSKENPFVGYMQKGSPGVKGFTENRILNADSLFSAVKKRKADYELSRNVLDGLPSKEKRVRAIYSALKIGILRQSSLLFILFMGDLIQAELLLPRELLLAPKCFRIWMEFQV